MMNETAVAKLTKQTDTATTHRESELRLGPQVYSPHHPPINTQLIVNEVTLLPVSVPHNNRS